MKKPTASDVLITILAGWGIIFAILALFIWEGR